MAQVGAFDGNRGKSKNQKGLDHTAFTRQLSFRALQRVKNGPSQVRAVAEYALMDGIIVCMNLFVREEGLFALLVACRNLFTFTAFTAAGASTHDCQLPRNVQLPRTRRRTFRRCLFVDLLAYSLLFPLLLDLPLFLWVFHDGGLLIGGCGLFRHGQLYSNNEVDRSLDLDACKVLALGKENRGQG